MNKGTKSKLLGSTKRRFVDVPVGSNGDSATYRIRSLTEKERSAYELSTRKSTGKEFEARLEDARRRLLVAVLVDDDGNPILGPLDAIGLQDVDSAITGRLFDAAWEHCGFARGDVENLVKNSDGAPGSEQPGGSPPSAENETSTLSTTA